MHLFSRATRAGQSGSRSMTYRATAGSTWLSSSHTNRSKIPVARAMFSLQFSTRAAHGAARGAGVIVRQWDQAKPAPYSLRGGWMHTGDCGRLDAHGILYVVDRVKDMIVSGAENVYSAEVESAISLHPGVAQCAVIGVPAPQGGERTHAVI